MMSKKAYIWVILLLILTSGLVLFLWYDPDRNLIDEEYLSTEEYRALNEKLDVRHRDSLDEQMLLKAIALQALKNHRVITLSRPVRLDSSDINRSLQPSKKIRLGRNGEAPSKFDDFTYYHLDTFAAAGYRMVFFLVEYPTMYREIELFLASASPSRQAVSDLAVIATYRNNLQEEVENIIEIGTDGTITTEVQKRVNYPIQQDNNYFYHFYIDSTGTIQSDLRDN